MKRILLSWSSGKDSAWSLHVLRQRAEYEVVGLLTTFNEVADRVAMHAVRHDLVERQAAAAGLPLWSVPLPWPCSNEQYESLMAQTCVKAVADGIEGIAFGDLFLEDVRAYREKQMKGTGLQPLFPVWGMPTRALAREMIASGTRAKLTCIDTEKLDRSFVGREFDKTWIPAANVGNSIPLCTQDPCSMLSYRFRSARPWFAISLSLRT
jgi:diphthamide synthase (EF-2-diphthine--ammonia ligase)